MKKPFISVIIPTWRESEVLNCCLSSLLNQNYPSDRFEIILISKNHLFYKNPKIKVVKIGQSVNHALARNAGVRRASGEVIAFCDDDCTLPKKWLSYGSDFFRKETVGLIGGPLLQPKNQSFAFRLGGYLMASPFGTGLGGLRWRIGSKVKEASEIDLILANNMVRRKVFEKINGFDGHQVPCEENLLYHRVLSLGYKILYAPKLYVFHRSKPIFLPLTRKVFFYSTGRGIFVARFPQRFRLTYLLPSVFLAFLLASLPIFSFSPNPYLVKLWQSLLFLYLFLALINSLYIFLKFEKNPLIFLFSPPGTFLIHTSYGLGFLNGYLSYLLKKRKAVRMPSKY